MSNAENPKNGAVFQKQVLAWFQDHFDSNFEIEKKLPIGKPEKNHKFDIVSTDNKIVIECKRYTWTASGNVPSAKMGFTNEAAFYLSFLPNRIEKYIVMLFSFHEKRNESLAEYYYRTYQHLLGNIKVAEYNPETMKLHVIGDTSTRNWEQLGVEMNSQDMYVFSKNRVEKAILFLQERKADISKYCDLLYRFSSVNIAEDEDFQRAFTAFYRVRRAANWRKYYFSLFEDMKTKNADTTFREILLRLFQQFGQIEASFSSKMLATINPDMPIWDNYVLNNLGLKLKGKNKEERFSMAVSLYDHIYDWYKDFLQTEEAKELIAQFDSAFPEYSSIPLIKKIDFIIWALR